jgi:hypothetical protein
MLQEDMQRCKVKDPIVESLLNAAIYGTGIAKINVMDEIEKVPVEAGIPGTLTTDVGVQEKVITSVKGRLT